MTSVDTVAPRWSGPLPAPGLHALADHYDVLLCDLWGVVHDGQRAFAPSVDALDRFRRQGGTVVLITNAPRPCAPVLDQIAGLGVPGSAFDALVTSGDVTIGAIAAAESRSIHHIGPPRDRALFEALWRSTGIQARLTSLEEAGLVVVTGLADDRSETPADYAEQLAAMRARDLPLICANPDIVVHVGDALIYCAGALADAYAVLGGQTILAGKPHPPIYDAAMALAENARGHAVDPARVLAIGDGLATDGLGAARRGIDFLLVTSGIHRDDFHPDPDAPLDIQGYARRIAALAPPPIAAMPSLFW